MAVINSKDNNKTTSSGNSRNKSTAMSFTSATGTNTVASMPLSNATANIEALKRKFQRVNQEIVKQNVNLHDQLARHRQEQHLVLQENVRLKGRLVALESKLREAEGVCVDTKKSIGDRIEILEVIGEHLIDVTKFLRLLSFDAEEAGDSAASHKYHDNENENDNDKENGDIDSNGIMNNKPTLNQKTNPIAIVKPIALPPRRLQKTNNNNNNNNSNTNTNSNNINNNNHLHPIIEEEDLLTLTDNIGDVSLKEFEFEPNGQENGKVNRKGNSYGNQSDSELFATESFKRKRH